MSPSTTRPTRIVDVEVVGDRTLALALSDGDRIEVDLTGELQGPVLSPLANDPELFRRVAVDAELGTVVWPNGADLDPDVLIARGRRRSSP